MPLKAVDHAGENLARLGMSPAGVHVKAPQYGRCEAALQAAGAGIPRASYWVPGRVELLGKHTDYAGGRSLLCAVERGFVVRIAPRKDGTIRVFDVARNERCDTHLGTGAKGHTGEWRNYVYTVARRVARDFPDARCGVDVAFWSDLPSAAGLSSSTVLVVVVALALFEANALPGSREFERIFPSREALAGYLGAVESGAPYGVFGDDTGVGTLGGSQDHVAVLCCSAGCVSQFAFGPIRSEGEFPFVTDYSLAVGVSGVTAHKGGGARDRYNRLSRAVARLLGQWNEAQHRTDATLAAAIAAGPDALHQMRAMTERAASTEFPVEDLRDRLEQFIEEAYTLVPAAADAFRRAAFEELGRVVDRSQHLAESMLGNQVPETIALQREARELGAAAASAFGAGFGGSVWALVPTEAAEGFIAEWAQAYRASHPFAARRSAFFLSPAGPRADRW